MKSSKNSILSLFVVLFSPFLIQGQYQKQLVQDGDIIFQTSEGQLGEAIQIATASEFSHVGIIYLQGEKPFVFEAIEPVSSVPLNEWIDRGKNDFHVIKRLKGADTIITTGVIADMRRMMEKWSDRHYDSRFDWSDAELYCSELVWKIYERTTGLRIGEPAPLYSYHLDDKRVQQRLRLHYGKDVPMEHKMISPQAMFECPLLETVSASPKKNVSKKLVSSER
jgi:hypothetical protein